MTIDDDIRKDVRAFFQRLIEASPPKPGSSFDLLRLTDDMAEIHGHADQESIRKIIREEGSAIGLNIVG